MKKIISILLTILMTVCCFSPYYAFAAENEENKYDCTVYQNESYASIESISLYSSNLITKNSFSIRKNGTSLILYGITKGNNEVKKCGFTKVIIQRKKSSENSWSNYKTYNDLFSESNSYTLNKSVAVEKGYQYRAKATHYAKKVFVVNSKNWFNNRLFNILTTNILMADFSPPLFFWKIYKKMFTFFQNLTLYL